METGRGEFQICGQIGLGFVGKGDFSTEHAAVGLLHIERPAARVIERPALHDRRTVGKISAKDEPAFIRNSQRADARDIIGKCGTGRSSLHEQSVLAGESRRGIRGLDLGQRYLNGVAFVIGDRSGG